MIAAGVCSGLQMSCTGFKTAEVYLSGLPGPSASGMISFHQQTYIYIYVYGHLYIHRWVLSVAPVLKSAGTDTSSHGIRCAASTIPSRSSSLLM